MSIINIIKSQIEKAAKEAGCTEIQIISAMQSECAKRGDEKTIALLFKIKDAYIKKMSL